MRGRRRWAAPLLAAALVPVAAACGGPTFVRHGTVRTTTSAPAVVVGNGVAGVATTTTAAPAGGSATAPTASTVKPTATTAPTVATTAPASTASRRGVVDRDRPCEVAPRSFDGTPVNRVERDDDGLRVIVVVDPLCTAADGTFGVSVTVRNVSGQRRAVSTARPVTGGVFTSSTAKPDQLWSFPCPPRGGGIDDPPDTPLPLDPGEEAQLAVARYTTAEGRCGVVGAGLFDVGAVVRSCTRLDGVCDAARTHTSAALRIQRR